MKHTRVTKPVIGISIDNQNNQSASGKYESDTAYARKVTQAGGVAVLLPQNMQSIHDYVQLCDGFLFTGGADPDMQPFGKQTHPRAVVMDPQRQAFDTTLMRALNEHPDKPVLGICWGMQLMALINEGDLNQHLPDTLASATEHQNDNAHAVSFCVCASVLMDAQAIQDAATTTVVSWHHQAVSSPGTLRKVAVAFDQTIEGIDDPTRRFYAGVQWHPERGDDSSLNLGIIRRFVQAAAASIR